MKFDNVWSAIKFYERPRPQTKKQMVGEIEALWKAVHQLQSSIESLETICIHKFDNRNCWDGHKLHDVVIALLHHTGLRIKKRHNLYLDKEE